VSGNSKASPSALFYRIAAACCAYYVVAQLLQEIVFHLRISDSASGETEILQRLTFLDQLRAVALLLGFSFIPILAAYAATALRRYPLRPALSLLGFAFSLLFVGSEAGVRSIDLFLVSNKWAAASRLPGNRGCNDSRRNRTTDSDVGRRRGRFLLRAARSASAVVAMFHARHLGSGELLGPRGCFRFRGNHS
jgi:hypothetical protein